MAADSFLSIRNIRKTYGSVIAVEDVTLDIAKSEFLTFLGPSGSGKSTTLFALAEFEALTSGEIILDGQPLLDIPSHIRNIGMVFQRYTLFPHLTVAENVAFPLRVRYGVHTFLSLHPCANDLKYWRPWRKVIGPGGLDFG